MRGALARRMAQRWERAADLRETQRLFREAWSGHECRPIHFPAPSVQDGER